KLITYPRTDSRHLGSDMRPKIPTILGELRPLKPEEIGRLDLASLPFTGRVIDDAKVGDHHAIVPTGRRPEQLPPGAERVYHPLSPRSTAAFYPACLKEVTSVAGASNGVPFRAGGVLVIEPGWTVLYPRRKEDAKEEEQELPEFRPGESGPHEPSIRCGETT